jgi:DNA replication protein DnaC
MEYLNFERCQALNNIPKKKLLEFLSTIENSSDDLQIKMVKQIAINRYAESNIPIEYWTLKMEKDFQGDSSLLTRYNKYIRDIKAAYINGISICFAGPHGVGKTFCCCSILKKSCQKGFSCQYCDLSNMISVLTQAPPNEKFISKIELSMVDFLCIDEIDPRFFATSDATNELYIKNLENIIRTRLQNKLPTLLCTNSPNMIESFRGALKESMGSIFQNFEKIVIFGDDFRKK